MKPTRFALALCAGALALAACSSPTAEPTPAPTSTPAAAPAAPEPAAEPVADAPAGEVPESVDAMCAELLPMFDAVRDLPGYDAAGEADRFLSHTAGSGELAPADEARFREAVRRAAAGEC